MDDNEQQMKLKVLSSLIDYLDNRSADSLRPMSPKGLGVTVEAKDKAGLDDGLEKAKSILAGSSDLPTGLDHDSEQPSDDMSDEDKLMQLLSDQDDDDDQLKG